MINYFETKAEMWGDIAFYGSSGMGIQSNDPMLADYHLDKSFFEDLKVSFGDHVEAVFDRKVRSNTSHAQKWDVGGFANPHSDNSDNDGQPNAFEINKYVAILYLNGDYEGGELYFPDHNIEFKPRPHSLIIFPGGVENIHGVKEITAGTRYTMVSFWDFLEAEYSEEKRSWWEEETKKVRKEQAKQKKEWAAVDKK
jgi:predicted 2-oxoglutarate/Fe(II)-dependent dioxygenase YbiX